MELSLEEMMELSERSMDQFLETSKDIDRFIALGLWRILQIEEKLKIAFPECELERKNMGFQLYGSVKLNNKEIATYNCLGAGGEVFITTFCPNKGKRADILIENGAIKLVKGYHRILDWHSLYKNGYVQNQAKNQWVMHFKPEIATNEQIDDLLTKLNNK